MDKRKVLSEDIKMLDIEADKQVSYYRSDDENYDDNY